MIVKENQGDKGSSVIIENGDACQRCDKQKDHHDALCQVRYYFENVKCIFHAFIFSCRHSDYPIKNALRRMLLYFLNHGYTKEDIHKELDNITLGGEK